MAKGAAEQMPEVEIERRVEWSDTDAAGHQHYTSILRWAEAAEAQLLRDLDLEWLFGRIPRVRHEVDYRGRLWFGQVVRTRLWVVRLGRTSIRYGFTVTGPDGTRAAEGTVTAAHALPSHDTASPWSEAVRELLEPKS
jgi:acyl-CoA thioester hydrolase